LQLSSHEPDGCCYPRAAHSLPLPPRAWRALTHCPPLYLSVAEVEGDPRHHSRVPRAGRLLGAQPLQHAQVTTLCGASARPLVPGAGRLLGAQPLQHAQVTTLCGASARLLVPGVPGDKGVLGAQPLKYAQLTPCPLPAQATQKQGCKHAHMAWPNAGNHQVPSEAALLHTQPTALARRAPALHTQPNAAPPGSGRRRTPIVRPAPAAPAALLRAARRARLDPRCHVDSGTPRLCCRLAIGCPSRAGRPRCVAWATRLAWPASTASLIARMTGWVMPRTSIAGGSPGYTGAGSACCRW